MSISISQGLQHSLISELLSAHDLPWKIQHETADEFLCEVISAKKHHVLYCSNEKEAVELIDIATAVSTATAKLDMDVDRAVHKEKVVTTKPKNAIELFDKLLPLALAANPDKAREINTIYCFKITGTDSGDWTVDCTAATPTCVRGSTGNAQCTIAVSSSDFASVIKDPNVAIQLYFQGKFVVTGDPVLAMKLQRLFELLPQ